MRLKKKKSLVIFVVCCTVLTLWIHFNVPTPEGLGVADRDEKKHIEQVGPQIDYQEDLVKPHMDQQMDHVEPHMDLVKPAIDKQDLVKRQMDQQKDMVELVKAQIKRQTYTYSAGGECKNKKPPPTKSANIGVMRSINQLKNCPCNVNYVNETNPLCANAHTLQAVSRRKPLTYVKQSLTPCVFVNKEGDDYQLVDITTERNSSWWFLNKPTTTKLYCLPSVYFPGVPKCGTTTLHSYLSKHPKIRDGGISGGWSFWDGYGFMEKNLFMDDNNNSRFHLFASMNRMTAASSSISKTIESKLKTGTGDMNYVLEDSLLLDATQGNYRLEALEKMMKFVPNRKCVIIMRDPVERAFSFFRFSAQIGDRKHKGWFVDQTPMGFHRYVNYTLVTNGPKAFSDEIYAIMARQTLDLMPKKDVAFVQLEEFTKDPVGVMDTQILPVLGLPPFTQEQREKIPKAKKANPSKNQYKMLNETRVLLQNHFRSYNHELSILLDDPKWTWEY